MPSTPESEETRVTDAGVEAAAVAIARELSRELSRGPLVRQFDAAAMARAALEAAAALHPPREGADDRSDDELRADIEADRHDGCRRVLEATETALSTTEAALAESRGEVERLREALATISTGVADHNCAGGWSCPRCVAYAALEASGEWQGLVEEADQHGLQTDDDTLTWPTEAPHEST